MTSRPSLASESRPCWKSSPPTCSYTTSTPRPSVARMTSATTSWVWWLIPTSRPSSFARSSFSSEPALPITNAPASFASCTAADPIPLPTELISTVSPGWSFARVKSMCQAVANAICGRGRVLVRELVRDADQLASRAGELLGVPARGGEADEAGSEAQGLTPRLAVAALAARVPSDRASPARRPASRRPRRRGPRCARRPRTPRMKGGATSKRDTPSRMSTSRWLSAPTAMSISTSPAAGCRVGHLLELQYVRPPELVKDDCLHLRPPSWDDRVARLCLTSGRESSPTARPFDPRPDV